jgi:hypothetical protein
MDMENKMKKASCLLVLLFLTCSQIALGVSYGSIKGYVLDKDTKKPIKGAIIFIQSLKLHAASNSRTGFYKIKDLPFGSYTVKCGKAPYQIEITEVTIDRFHPRVNYNFSLFVDSMAQIDRDKASESFYKKKPTISSPVVDGKGFGSLSGTVCDSYMGLPILGARVVLDRTYLGALVNPGDGTYLISKIPSGIYTALSDCIGYNKSIIDSIVIKPDSLTVRLFALGAGKYKNYEGGLFPPNYDREAFIKLHYYEPRINAIPYKSIGKVIEVLAR